MMIVDRKFKVDDKVCYTVKEGYSRKHKTPLVSFCGEFIMRGSGEKLNYDEVYVYTIQVDKFDPQADTIFVLKTIGLDNSQFYRPFPVAKIDSFRKQRNAKSKYGENQKCPK